MNKLHQKQILFKPKVLIDFEFSILNLRINFKTPTDFFRTYTMKTREQDKKLQNMFFNFFIRTG